MNKTDNATDQKVLDKKKLNENFNKKREIKDWEELLNIPTFRRVIWDLMVECKMNELSFTGNSTTFFNEGQRNIGLKIQSKIVKSNPDAYLKMMVDAQKREESNV